MRAAGGLRRQQTLLSRCIYSCHPSWRGGAGLTERSSPRLTFGLLNWAGAAQFGAAPSVAATRDGNCTTDNNERGDKDDAGLRLFRVLPARVGPTGSHEPRGHH
jgi:hypothetical protein